MRQSNQLPSKRHPAHRRLALRALGATATTLLLVLAAPLGAAADDGRDERAGKAPKAFVPAPLFEAASADPDRVFDVIVQGRAARNSDGVAADVRVEHSGKRKLRLREFDSISGVATQLRGDELLRLARKKRILAITPNAPVRLSGFSNKQKWPYVAGAPKLWGYAESSSQSSSLQMPAIAIVDSGIDANRPDFAGRVREQVTIGVRGPNSAGDGRGHGTFVASIAAGAGPGRAGVAPSAPLVSVDVVDDAGLCMTADVIAAADWILANKERLGIRVANFSLHASNPGSFMFDPLNRAVERLWFGGVVVVAAAGNYGHLGRGVPYAPGNDPFVITVGASDIDGSIGVYDDFEAPWSAYGYTLDGFAKPDLGAPGRHMIGAVPATATLALERPDRVVSPGYMQLSGTSFAAPIVSGAAAVLLAKRPDLTPDQVKGALMLTAKHAPDAAPLSFGVGEVNLAKASDVSNPPNPNLALNRFLVPDPAGSSAPVFDAASWTSAAQSDASWTSATWTSASWTSASWTSASWTSASWTSASWTSASWTSASWTSASWTSASWTSTSESDASLLSSAEMETNAGDGYEVTADEFFTTEIELDIDLNGDGIVGAVPTSPVTNADPTSLPVDESSTSSAVDADSTSSGSGDSGSSGGGDSGSSGDDDSGSSVEVPATTTVPGL
jgi:serine protease AprX